MSDSPRTWVLLDDRPGNSTQTLGLVRSLGWPFEIVQLHFGGLARLHPVLMGASRRVLDRSRSDALEPPWPDLVIAAGGRTAAVSRWIRRQSGGATRIVQLGRRGGAAAKHFDLVATPRNARLRPHPKRIETLLPLCRIDPTGLEDAADAWRERLELAASPRIAVLVGGASALYRFEPEDAAALARKVHALARETGGSVWVSTSRRTGKAATDQLAESLPDAAWFHDWSRDSEDNPFLAYLALADWIVVTGESESMLAEVCATAKPVLIYPLEPARAPTWRRRLGEVIVARAQRKGGGLCAWLIASGLVLPPRRLEALHRDLIANGRVDAFKKPPRGTHREPLMEVEEVAARVRSLFESSAP
jgi:hypothetical protein